MGAGGFEHSEKTDEGGIFIIYTPSPALRAPSPIKGEGIYPTQRPQVQSLHAIELTQFGSRRALAW